MCHVLKNLTQVICLIINEVKLTGPTKPSSEVLVKCRSLMGTPDDNNGMVWNKTTLIKTHTDGLITHM